MANLARKAYGINVITPLRRSWLNRFIFALMRAWPLTMQSLRQLRFLHFARWLILPRDRWPGMAGPQQWPRHDDPLLEGCLFEALRFAPGDPVIDRRALKSTTIARGSLRACRVPQGAMVLASKASAMFDPAVLRRGLSESGGVAGDA